MGPTADQFAGCMLGLACGDALGAPFEGGMLERLTWRLIGQTQGGQLRWTDDTQMALDLAESLLDEKGVRADAIASRFASSYRWSRGYGPGTARVLKRIRRGEPWESASRAVHADGSYGNGAAMRAPVLALYFAMDKARLIDAARTTARVTHAHPLGIEGAVLVALAAHALLWRVSSDEVLEIVRRECTSPEFSQRLEVVATWIGAKEAATPRQTAERLGNGTASAMSCPTALYAALRYLEAPFADMMQFIIECGGDVDTIGAMAGALWGISNGAGRLPPVKLEARMELERVASRMFQHYQETKAERAVAADDAGGPCCPRR